MNYDATLLGYFIHASLVVKVVMIILITVSVLSWAYILERRTFLRKVARASERFEESFWTTQNLTELYAKANVQKHNLTGMEAIFHAGFKEFMRLRKQANPTTTLLSANIERAMRAALMREQERLENHLSFLAIVGSTSPYIGLFGTVWGIMQSFRSLANVTQATIAMVAPGIAEALIATALGLFAAIPAVIAYNRFANEISRILNRYDAFQEEFLNVLIRESQPVRESHLEITE